MRKYPDVSKLLAQKEARRQRLAKLPAGKKMEIANHLRTLGDEIRNAVKASRSESRSQNGIKRIDKKSTQK
jgi:hypothetical protein